VQQSVLVVKITSHPLSKMDGLYPIVPLHHFLDFPVRSSLWLSRLMNFAEYHKFTNLQTFMVKVFNNYKNSFLQRKCPPHILIERKALYPLSLLVCRRFIVCLVIAAKNQISSCQSKYLSMFSLSKMDFNLLYHPFHLFSSQKLKTSPVSIFRPLCFVLSTLIKKKIKFSSSLR
jgi:hypothetical protein